MAPTHVQRVYEIAIPVDEANDIGVALRYPKDIAPFSNVSGGTFLFIEGPGSRWSYVGTPGAFKGVIQNRPES